MRRFINLLEGLSATPTELFLKDFEEATQPHPTDRYSRMLGNVEVCVVPANENPDSSILLADLQAQTRGEGEGSAALKAICALADEYGVTLNLNAKPYGDSISQKKLIAWYTRAGFTITQKGGGGFATLMQRKPHHALNATPLDENDEIPDVVYHGTTLAAWQDSSDDGTMFFTSNREDAQNYAEEAAVAEHHRGGFPDDAEKLDDSIKPIIVSFKLEDLKKLETRGAELQPDWGWLDGHQHAEGDVPTWVESFQHVGSFCIAPFKHEYKSLGTIANAF